MPARRMVYTPSVQGPQVDQRRDIALVASTNRVAMTEANHAPAGRGGVRIRVMWGARRRVALLHSSLAPS